MKNIIQIMTLKVTLTISFQIMASPCPFNEPNIQPEWISNMTPEEDVISGVALESFDPKIHTDVFIFRKYSEVRAKQALAQNLSASVYNSILSNKAVTNGKLVKTAQSVVEQVTEQTLPDSQVESRWLDKEHCLLWSKVIVGADVVDEYIDEISELELEINEHLDNNLASTVVETLNAKQFFINYDGFSKAVNQEAMLTYNGITKPVLAWMLDNGFDMFEPSLVSAGNSSEGVSRYQNTNSFEFFMNTEEMSIDKISYILSAYKKSQQSYNDLATPILSHDGTIRVLGSRNAGIKFSEGVQISRVNAPFALGIRFTQDQPYWDVPKVTNIYAQKPELLTGKFSMLHLVTLYKRYDLVEFFLDEGFDPNVKDINNMSPAQYAVAIEDEKLIDLFLDTKIQLDGVYETAVHKSIYIVNNFLYVGYDKSGEKSVDEIKAQVPFGGVDYRSKVLLKYKKVLKKKDKSNIKSSQKLLKQSIAALNAFWKDGKYANPKDTFQKLTKDIFDKSVKRLNDMI